MEQVIVKNQSEEYMVNVIRSKRKTMALQVGLDGTVVARVPEPGGKERGAAFFGLPCGRGLLRQGRRWPGANRKSRHTGVPMRFLHMIPCRSVRKMKSGRILCRLMYYAPKIGVTFERVAIRNQKGRWGSSRSKRKSQFQLSSALSATGADGLCCGT